MKKEEAAAVVIINVGGFCCFLICLIPDMTVEIVNSATKKQRKLEICVLPVCVWLYGV